MSFFNVGPGLKTTRVVLVLAATFIGGWEGYDAVAKHNSFDPPGVITIGNGLTNFDMPGLKAGMRCGKEVDCKGKFAEAMGKYDAQMTKAITVAMPPHRHVAMISFTYNVGQGNILKSAKAPTDYQIKHHIQTSRVAWYINHGDIKMGCEALMSWTRANGRVLNGLVNRRKAEREWCLRND